MTEPEEVTDAEVEMLPPGEYPFWTPYDCYEAAAMLMQAFEERLVPCVETHGYTAQTPQNTASRGWDKLLVCSEAREAVLRSVFAQ